MDIFEYYHDNEVDGVVLVSDFLLNYFNLMNAPYRRLSFTKDRLFMSSFVFNFRKNSILKDIYNEKLGRLRQFGLIKFWISNYIDKRKMKSNQGTNFHIENIFGILRVCAVMYLISLVVFILEVIGIRYLRIVYIIDYLTY